MANTVYGNSQSQNSKFPLSNKVNHPEMDKALEKIII